MKELIELLQKMLETTAKTLIINLAVLAVWYAMEWGQFGELQWDRECDEMVWYLYYMIIWYLLYKKGA